MFRSRILRYFALLSGLALALNTAYAVEVRPQVDGTLELSCRTTSSCTITSGGLYTPQFDVTDGMQYVTVQDLVITDSTGTGLRIGDGAHHIIVDNVEVAYIANTNMWTRRGTSQIHIKNSSFHHGAVCWHWFKKPSDDVAFPPRAGSIDACEQSGTSIFALAQSQVDGEPALHIVENNDAYVIPQEIIGVFDTEAFWIVGNRVRNSKTGHIVIDHAHDNIIESNICWNYDSTSDTTMGTSYFGTFPDWNGRCIVISMEPHQNNNFSRRTYPNIVRNNLAVNGGIIYDINPELDTFNPENVEGGAQIYGNTVILGQILGEASGATSTNYELQVVNNLVDNDGGTACNFEPPGTFDVHRVSNNQYTRGTVGSNCGTNIGTGKPSFARDADTWGITNWVPPAQPTFADAVLQVGDDGIDAGTALQANLSTFDDMDWAYFGDVDYPYAPTGANWEKENFYDATGQSRSLTTPNVGVDETN